MTYNCPHFWISGAAAEKLAKGKTEGKKVKVQAEIEIHRLEFVKDAPTNVQVGVHSLDGVSLEESNEYSEATVAGMSGSAKMNRTIGKAMAKVMGGSHKSKEKESY